jgi:hypothetical protein
MSKTVYLVSKTHLDLGYTDFAGNIRKKYISEFIPSAAKAAKEINSGGVKKFVWTTGSWILKEALRDGSAEEKKLLEEAMAAGDIVAHALPFTTHTELLDADTLRYGLSIVKELDGRFNRRTVAAKMTDVPGHTAAIVPILNEFGIKLLHIGVNDASAIPEVPPTFLWRFGGGEVVVIYEGSYGGEYKCPLIDEILYFAHTSDNRGPVSAEKALENYENLKEKYPDYEVVASGLDPIAEKLWEARGNLPVVTSEIGDSWIHGSATDPYKSAALRELIAFKNEKLLSGDLKRESSAYHNLADDILCLAEHTNGLDVKTYLADYSHYLKKDFIRARKRDLVRLSPLDLFKDYPHNYLTFKKRRSGEYKTGSYSAMEKSWAEQREYITKALSALPEKLKAEAEGRLLKLRPENLPEPAGQEGKSGEKYSAGKFSVSVNDFGSADIFFNGKHIISGGRLDYVSYGVKDYDFWLDNYTRDIQKSYEWAIGDFARPGYGRVSGKYPEGRFSYTAEKTYVKTDGEKLTVSTRLGCGERLVKELGAPAEAMIVYSAEGSKLNIKLYWVKKDLNRLTEALFLRLFPVKPENLRYYKLGSAIDPFSVVVNGNRNLSAVEKITFETNGKKISVENLYSPLVALGEGKILKFDNVFEDIGKDGISYLLYDNVWGTNFPLYYGDNAYFEYEITVQ